MDSIWLVALGGALGSVARQKLSAFILAQTMDWRFPLGTFSVNVVGCLVIGILAGLAVKQDFFSTDARYFLFTGVIGGFTTFSAFGLETFQLLRRDEMGMAAGYVALSLICGLLAIWAGFSAITHHFK